MVIDIFCCRAITCFLFHYFPGKCPGGYYLVKRVQTDIYMTWAIHGWIAPSFYLEWSTNSLQQHPVRGTRQAWVDSPVKTALCLSVCVSMPQGVWDWKLFISMHASEWDLTWDSVIPLLRRGFLDEVVFFFVVTRSAASFSSHWHFPLDSDCGSRSCSEKVW